MNYKKMANFTKPFKKSSNDILSEVERMLSVGSTFSCQTTKFSMIVSAPKEEVVDDKDVEGVADDKDVDPPEEDNCTTVQDNNITVYPSLEQVNAWFKILFTETLKQKPPKKLSQKAIDSMKKVGKTPKSPGKPPSDAIVIVVAPGTAHVHVGVMVPTSMKELDHDFVTHALGERKITCTQVGAGDGDTFSHYFIVSHESTDTFKVSDDIHREFFEELKVRGIYVDDESDGEMGEMYTLDDE